MPALLTFAIIMAVFALIGWAVAVFASDEDFVSGGRTAGIIFTVVAVALLGFASMTTVSTKTVGVTTSFGKPTGTLSNGLHTKAPWEKVSEFDAAIQTDDHVAAPKATAEDCGKGITARIVGQATACVDVSIRWRIKPDVADDLYREHKDFDNVRHAVVTRDLIAAVSDTFAAYDPLAALAGRTPAQSQTLGQLAAKVQEAMVTKAGGQIEVLSVTIPLIRHDAQTQAKINAFQGALADTRIAEQRKETARQEAETNRILADSAKGAGVIEQRCLDLVREIYRAGQQIPPGFTCLGGGAPVIVGQR